MSGIPFTVVAGYLGSGKTTAIIEYLLRPGVEPTAVIVNDFGELAVDAALLPDTDGMVSFSNGCICCEATDGLGPALTRIRRLGPARVLLEASGVADPGPLAGWAGSPGYTPGGVVVCADASTLVERLANRWVGDTVARQLAAAGTVLLTHADLAGAATLSGATARVRLLAPTARLLTRPGAGLADAVLPGTAGEPREPAPVGEHARHRSWLLSCSRPLPREQLEHALRSTSASVHRIKGFVRLAPEEPTELVQVAGERVRITAHPGADDPLPAGRTGLLTVTGLAGQAPGLDALNSLGFTTTPSAPAARPSA